MFVLVGDISAGGTASTRYSLLSVRPTLGSEINSSGSSR